MERGNTKHGRHLDDSMAHEVRGIVQGGVDPRVEEWHDPEPPGEDQPDATFTPGGVRPGGAPPGMTYDEVEQRSRLGRYIPKASLPGGRSDLLQGAYTLNAPGDILEALRGLPEDEEYQTVSQVWAALGHHNEAQRT